MANYALRIPESLFAYARLVAKEEQVSMNQFFVTAIAEKVSALKTEEFFRERRERADPAALGAWLESRPNVPPMPGDELTPELAAQVKAWLDVKKKVVEDI